MGYGNERARRVSPDDARLLWRRAAEFGYFTLRPNQLEVLKNHPQLAEAGFADHREIADSLERGSMAETTRLLRRHIRRSGVGLVQFLRGLPAKDRLSRTKGS